MMRLETKETWEPKWLNINYSECDFTIKSLAGNQAI